MVNTLRITSVAAVLMAAAVLVSVLGPKSLIGFAMKDDAKLDQILNSPNVVEKFRASQGSGGATSATQTPMLVQLAETFAKILDPPVTPKTDAPGSRGAMALQPVVKGPPQSAKFTLVGLSYSGLYPEWSFAYIRLADGTYQWARRGDEIGHITIREIRRDSILCWDGSRESEMMVAQPVDTASLLEGGAGPSTAMNSVASPPVSLSTPSSSPAISKGVALDRITSQIKLLQKASSGEDANSSAHDRAAVMDRLISEYRSSRLSPEEAEKLGNLGEELKESRGAPPAQKPTGFRRPLSPIRSKTR
jgi:hypothetical protein